MFSRILVAYDDSPGARRALDVALELTRLGTDVELIAAAVEAHLPHYGATVGEYEEERAFETRRCQHWLETASVIAAQSGNALTTEILAGHPAQELLKVAAQRDVDLIVLGHSGHSGVWGRFLGSTVEKVSRHANCSVLIAAPTQGRHNPAG